MCRWSTNRSKTATTDCKFRKCAQELNRRHHKSPTCAHRLVGMIKDPCIFHEERLLLFPAKPIHDREGCAYMTGMCVRYRPLWGKKAGPEVSGPFSRSD